MFNKFVFQIQNNLQFIECLLAPSEIEYYNMQTFFRKKRKSAYMEPAVRNGYSDGCTSFFVRNCLPIGLWGELEKYCSDRGFELEIKGMEYFINNAITLEDISAFVDNLFIGVEPEINVRWYQYESIFKIIKYRYSAQQVSTAAGKTLISYSVAQYLKKIGKISVEKKFLMIVPRKDLVGQTVKKFTVDYYNEKYPLKVMGIGGDYKYDEKTFNESEVIISTYQSLNTFKDNIFKSIRVINVDEAHTAKTDSIKRAIRLSMPLSYRFGLSGTIMVGTGYADYYENLSMLGPITFIYNPKNLIEDGFAPTVKIRKVVIDYAKRINSGEFNEYLEFYNSKPSKGSPEELEYFKALYKLERDMITSDEQRTDAIVKYVSSLKKNVLVLFNDVKGEFGKRLAEKMNEYKPTKYIFGGTKNLERSLYTEEIEKSDMNLVASFGTFSTGIDLKNVHYIVFAESYKSPILIGQSIGRGLRNFKNKKTVTIIDFVDNAYKHTQKQYDSREEIYKKQNYEITKESIVL